MKTERQRNATTNEQESCPAVLCDCTAHAGILSDFQDGGPRTSNWHSIKGGNYKEKYISCAISTNVNFKFAVNTVLVNGVMLYETQYITIMSQ